MDAPAEKVLAERWELLDALGEGAMGEVWRGRHAQLGHEVAIKVMKRDSAYDQNLVGRFRREARIAANLRHRNIARVEDIGTTADGRPFLVMEYLRGETLSKVLQKNRLPDRAFVMRAVHHIAAACDAAHAAGIVHRDLKPENCYVVRDEDGEALIKVLDFGVAKVTDGMYMTQNGVVTASHALLGTPVYMSPEQARGEPDIDGRSDLWSLGVMTYEMLTAKIPFEAPMLAQVLFAVLGGAIAPPSSLDRSLPPALDQWMQRALTRNKQQRFQSGKELSSGLGVALGVARPTPASVSADASWSLVPSMPPSMPSAMPMAVGQSGQWANSVSGQQVVPERTVPLPAVAGTMNAYASQDVTSSRTGTTQMPSMPPSPMMSSAPYAPPAALTWSGAGGGAPVQYPSHSGVRAVPPAATYPTTAPAYVAPTPAPAQHATSHGSVPYGRGPHRMGLIFLVAGALAAVALGAVVVRSRHKTEAAVPPSTVAVPLPTPLQPTPLLPTKMVPTSEPPTPSAVVAPSTAGVPTNTATQPRAPRPHGPAAVVATTTAPAVESPRTVPTTGAARAAQGADAGEFDPGSL